MRKESSIRELVESTVESVIKENQQPKKKRVKHIKELEIVSNGDQCAKKIDFKDIRGKPKLHEIREEIGDWTSKDFALHFMERYREKCDPNFHCNVIAIVTRVNEIHDCILQTLGFCDNVVLRDYIDFIVTKWMKYLLAQNGGTFRIAWLRRKEILSDFVESYDYKDRITNYLHGKDESLDSPEIGQEVEQITGKALKEAFSLGYDNLFIEYGFIGSMNWLIIDQHIQMKTVLDKIVIFMARYNKKPEMEKAFENTERLNPYPSRFVVKSYDIIRDRLKESSPNSVERKVVLSFDDTSTRWSF